MRARLDDGLGCRSPRRGHSRVAETAMLQRGMTKLESASELSNAELLAEVKSAAQGEWHATARLVALLAEVDTRRLYLGEVCSSLFSYCTQVLHLSDSSADPAPGRSRAGQVCRDVPPARGWPSAIRISLRSRGCQKGSVETGWRSVRVHWCVRTLHRARVPGVSSREAVCRWRGDGRGESRAALSGAQRGPGGAALRESVAAASEGGRCAALSHDNSVWTGFINE